MQMSKAFFAAASVALFAGAGFADETVIDKGTSTTEYLLGTEQTPLKINPSRIWYNTSHVTMGVGMRNQHANGGALSGCPLDVVGPDAVKAVIFHWSYTGVDKAAPPADLDLIQVRRFTPAQYAQRDVYGERIGVSEENCWEINSNAEVYRAIVEPGDALFTQLGFDVAGNGTFGFVLPAGTTAIHDHRHPWQAFGYLDDRAAFDGVSMTVVYKSDEDPRGMGETLLFDKEQGAGYALAADLFNISADYQLQNLSFTEDKYSKLSFVSFGGQIDRESGWYAQNAFSSELTQLFIDNKVNGNSSSLDALGKSLYEGEQGNTSPQLMDARSFEMLAALTGSDLLVEVRGDQDCIIPGAVIVTQR